MIKLLLPLLITLLAGCAVTPETTSPQAPVLTAYQQQASYANGVDYMKSLSQDDLSVDQDAFLLGVNDVLANREPRLSTAEMTKAKDWQLVEQAKHRDAKLAASLAAGLAFLANNQSQEGVKALPSGLQYKVLAAGSGEGKPKTADTIEINYRLSKTDGVEIDSTLKRGKPAITALKNLIPGVKEALQLMPKGAKWQLFIPPNLAYGENGTPDGKIKPNETLVFDIELVSINPPTPVKPLAEATPAPAPQPIPSSTWR
jgi:FKBP-type peptidyl-prolyl cis-trans isomerase